MDRFPRNVGIEAAEMLVDRFELYKANVFVGSELADDALDRVASSL